MLNARSQGTQAITVTGGDVVVERPITCLECQAVMVDRAHATKHAIYHYGDDKIPPYPDHDEAARRKAHLLGVEPDSLRGFPQRRW